MIRQSIAAAFLSIILIGAAPPPERPMILAFGDSLTAGYGLERGLGFAPQLQATLRRRAEVAERLTALEDEWLWIQAEMEREVARAAGSA